MDIQVLRYFITVARTENMSHAAAHYYLPQSAMSRAISRLEEEVGTKLFDRSYNRIRLNDSGRMFLKTAEKVVSLLDYSVNLLRDDGRHPSGEIYLLLLQYRPLIANSIAAFGRQYPEVSFNISHNYQELQTFERGLCISSIAPSGVRCERELLIREPLVLAVSKSHPMAKRSSVKLTELRGEAFISLSPQNSLWKTAMEHCHRLGFEIIPKLECNDVFFAWKYIKEGLGISFISQYSWRELDLSQLILLPVDEPNFFRETYLYRPESQKQSTAASMFSQAVRDTFQRLTKQ